MEFIESLTFTRIITELVSDDDYAEFQSELAKHPERGGPMAECGGIEKPEWLLKAEARAVELE